MGYTLMIGEAELDRYDDGLDSSLSISVSNQKDEKAPAYGEPTDFTNSRWPSYSSWRNAMKFVGLEDIFWNEENGLIRHHPGCQLLTIEHKQIIDKAYEDFYKKYPTCKAGYSPLINNNEGVFHDTSWPEENGMATRLEWLKYWVDWAIENCKNPIFYNS